MKIIWVWLRWLVLVPIVIITLAVVYIVFYESIKYFNRSAINAEAAAAHLFYEICAEKKMDSSLFSGPERPNVQQDEERHEYTFLWKRNPDETIRIVVSYFPYDVEESISRKLIEDEYHR